MLLPLRGVATPGHGEGEGSAGDKFRVSGTQETVEGAGANEVSGVLSEASCCRCGAPLIKKKRPTLFSRPLFLRKQNGKLFSLSRYQIPQCLKGMIQNHPWSAIAHYFANPGSHFRSVTMHSAFMTFGLLLTEPAMLKSCK